ncbi:hypothetical protein BDQ12DRAFT_730355 [Crucibulum laeve]|uniref:CUE domain-containing protein n=1 Tax=Crucibulum laeve TaxID=68775 RepID=A0A5C3MSG4_9AGAR|nr:hypothetical protein BDQ12DRAFT_730355 [Crucibulum laeve]
MTDKDTTSPSTDTAPTSSSSLPTTSSPPAEHPQASTSPKPVAETGPVATHETNPFIEIAAAQANDQQGAASASPPHATSPAPPTSHVAPAINQATRPSADQHRPQETEAPGDPRLAALRAMFPDYDDTILQSVLESVGGNQDRAIDALLGMSDPDYRSEAQPEEPQAQAMSQTELDEQLARRLMLEEQQEQQRQWEVQQQPQQRPPQFMPHRRDSRPQAQQQQSQGGDTMAEFQEQFTKIAETGKKTFGNIFSKVKAKIQEFDQSRPGQSSSTGTQPTWGGNGSNTSGQQGYYAPPQGNYQPTAQQPAFYDPNTPVSSPGIPPAPQPRTAAPTEVQGYDVTPDPVASAPTDAAANASAGTPRPPQTTTGTPIDGGKLGLLPKRPVSLMRDPQQPQRKPSEDDDGLEYTENPFEDSRK